MLIYVIRRSLQIPVVVFAIVLLSFALIHLAPGDPVAALIGDAPATPEYIAELRQHLGLDRPVSEQLALYVSNMVRADLGDSYYYKKPVLELVLERLPATALLMCVGLTAGTFIGIGLGVVSAMRPNSIFDIGANLAALMGYSLPTFWLGQLALLVFALYLGWFPAQGMYSLRESQEGLSGLVDRARHLALPAAVLASWYVAVNYRLTRSGMLEVLSQEYIVTARAKGLAARVVLFRHALRNALLPVVTVAGLNLGLALSGAVFVEVVFGWPGLGSLTLDAISHRDHPVLMGMLVFTTAGVVALNFLTDLVYAVVDPRIKIA